MRRKARTRGSMSAWTLARNLAVVLGACLAIRLAADALAGAEGTGLPEGLGAAILSMELPFAGAETDGNPSGLIMSGELPGNPKTGKAGTDLSLTENRTKTESGASGTAAPEDPGAGEPDPDEAPDTAPEVPLKDAISTTIRGSGESYAGDAEGIYLKNKTTYTVDVEGLLQKPLELGADAAVLIVHTHGSEAYNPAGEDIYTESDPSRTEDRNFNVVRVGDELEKVLTERGVTVYHDRELHDYPSYTGAYNRSLASIEKYMEEHPDIEVVIDLHRDALEGDGKLYKTVADVGDTPCAQVMLICGSDFSGLTHPNWRENMSFALKLQRQMLDLYPTLARPLKLSQYCYNQNVTPCSILAEVGTNGNTLREALTAVRYFGQCLADILTGEM